MSVLTLKNGRSLPLIGFGTYKILGKEIVAEALNAAFSAGYRLIDTAGVYRNEADIGAALPGLLEKHGLQRSDIFITSKLAPKSQGSGNCREACLQSLRDLGLDYLDLYLIHWPGTQGLKPDDARHSEFRKQSWVDMEQLYDEGMLRSIGVSNYTTRHLTELLEHCRIKPTVLQVECHPHLVQKDLRDFCVCHDIAVQAYSSLGTSNADNKLLADPEVSRIAAECGHSTAQVLLRWAIQQNIAVLPKSTNAAHIRSNASIFDFELMDDQMSALDKLDQDVHYCWNPSAVL